MFDEYEWSSSLVGGLFLLGGAATSWAGARLRAERFTPQTLAGPLIVGALVSLLDQPQPTWFGALTGGALILAGLVTAWGWAINDRVLRRLRTHRLYAPPEAIRALTRPRHSGRIGRVLIALGVAFVAASSSHTAIFLAFLLADGLIAAREERRLRVSGEHTKMVGPFWNVETSVYFLVIVLVVASIGSVLDGSLTWVEPGWTIEQSAPLLQALLATTIAVAALCGTVTGIALQIRSTAFGVEIALAVLPRWRLAAVVPLVSVAALLTAMLLGRWSTLHNELGALLPSISVHLSILAILYVLWVTLKSVSSLMRNEPLVDYVGASVGVADWADQIRMYGWNAERGMQSPNSLRLLERALLGAMRQSDVWLFDALVAQWTSNVRTHPVIAALEPFMADPQERRKTRFDAPLAWDKAAFFDGLDIGLSQLSSALAARPDFNEYLARLAPMPGIVYPAIDPERSFYRDPVRSSPPPGFRVLHSLTAYAANAEDRELVRWLISAHWANRLQLAVVWAERASSTDDNDHFHSIDYAEQAFESLATLTKAGPTGRDEDRNSAVWAVLDALDVAGRHGTIRAGLSVIDAMNPYHDASWPWHFERMKTLTRKPSTPIGWMMRMVERSVDELIASGTDRSWSFRREFGQIGEWWGAVVATIPDRTHTRSDFAEDRFKEELQRRGVDVLTRLLAHLLDAEPEFASDTRLDQRGIIGELLGFLAEAPPAIQDSIIAFVREWAQGGAARSWAVEACDRYVAAQDSAES